MLQNFRGWLSRQFSNEPEDSPGHGPRYETLDAWRGVACLMVVINHAGVALQRIDLTPDSPVRWHVLAFIRSLEQGVPLFFVISGYCIAASLDARRKQGASSWSFLARRFWRIYPPYWSAVLIFVALTLALDWSGFRNVHGGGHSLKLLSPGQLDWAQWLGNLTLTETWRPRVWGGRQVEVYTQVAWSLCFEEQFYIVSFLALLVAPRRLSGMLGALTAAIVGFRVFAHDSGYLFACRGTFPVLWHEFAVGLAVYWRLVAAPTAMAKRAVEAAIFLLLAVGVATSYQSTINASAFGLVLIVLRGRDVALSRLEWLMPLRACGRRCYSIYLVHLPFCVLSNESLVNLGLAGFWQRTFVVIPLSSMIGIGAGWAFFAAVESRFLDKPTRSPKNEVTGTS